MSQPKLVRDKIPDIIRSQGLEPVTRPAADGEFRRLLCAKLSEEVEEFLDSHDPDELADVLEVLLALAEDLGVGREGLEARREQKAAERGAFTARLVWSGNKLSQANPEERRPHIDGKERIELVDRDAVDRA